MLITIDKEFLRGSNRDPLQHSLNNVPRYKEINKNEYQSIHVWLAKTYGKASKCESHECKRKSKRFEWALKKECKYEKKIENFTQLCKSCHISLDFSEAGKKRMSVYIEITRQKSLKTKDCERCNKLIEKATPTQKYCIPCQKLVHRDSMRAFRRKRSKKYANKS